jgi:hypothetical protein
VLRELEFGFFFFLKKKVKAPNFSNELFLFINLLKVICLAGKSFCFVILMYTIFDTFDLF